MIGSISIDLIKGCIVIAYFLFIVRIYSEMLSKKGESDRFSKVLQKLNPPSEKIEPYKLP